MFVPGELRGLYEMIGGLIFRDGEPVDGIIGAAPKHQIESKLKPHLGS